MGRFNKKVEPGENWSFSQQVSSSRFVCLTVLVALFKLMGYLRGLKIGIWVLSAT